MMRPCCGEQPRQERRWYSGDDPAKGQWTWFEYRMVCGSCGATGLWCGSPESAEWHWDRTEVAAQRPVIERDADGVPTRLWISADGLPRQPRRAKRQPVSNADELPSDGQMELRL